MFKRLGVFLAVLVGVEVSYPPHTMPGVYDVQLTASFCCRRRVETSLSCIACTCGTSA